MGAVNKLTAVQVKALDKRGRYGDGRGLWLQVSKWSTKSWLFRYMIDGRPREMGHGPVKLQENDGGVTLAEAREKRDELHRLLRDGGDPSRAVWPSGMPGVPPPPNGYVQGSGRALHRTPTSLIGGTRSIGSNGGIASRPTPIRCSATGPSQRWMTL